MIYLCFLYGLLLYVNFTRSSVVEKLYRLFIPLKVALNFILYFIFECE